MGFQKLIDLVKLLLALQRPVLRVADNVLNSIAMAE